MKKLSVIIINYNVCHFLEQTLLSVRKAIATLDAEVIVADNNSVDGSVEMVKAKFPEVILILNKKNLGFSKANNEAIKRAKGEYVLLLNPDTVVEEDTFTKCCSFMDAHPDAGALGVKMVDGKGNFLPESKRGLPTPWVAFYKIFGLAALFPKSRKFGRYHMGFLDPDQTNEVEVLSGAFMFIRKSVLGKTGLLDEDFFMYGEDIDLSYRIVKAGYKNYYFPETRIIHYKGESTKKTSVNYVFVFYKAMAVFARKHFNSKNAGIFAALIHLAIYLRAALSIIKRFVKSAFIPLLDGAVIYVGMYLLKTYWEDNYKWAPGKYPPEFMNIAVPSYIIIWLFSIYLNGGYNKFYKPSQIIRGAVIGTIFISAISNFTDDFRFSKALILMGGFFTVVSLLSIRYLRHFIFYSGMNLGEEKDKRTVIVGNGDESIRIINLIKERQLKLNILGYLSPEQSAVVNDNYLGSAHHIKDIINIYKVEEIIFCSKDISSSQIIEWMTGIDNRQVEYKIVPQESNYVIGSNSKENPGELYTLDIKLNIEEENHLRNKRMLDVILGIVFLILSPFLMWFMKSPLRFLNNIIEVISGKLSWVGFSDTESGNLPKIRKGVLNPASRLNVYELDSPTLNKLNVIYAKEYNVYSDLQLIFKSFRNLG